jgi:hypothetical protein
MAIPRTEELRQFRFSLFEEELVEGTAIDQERHPVLGALLLELHALPIHPFAPPFEIEPRQQCHWITGDPDHLPIVDWVPHWLLLIEPLGLELECFCLCIGLFM